jgi:hypothetical protein
MSPAASAAAGVSAGTARDLPAHASAAGSGAAESADGSPPQQRAAGCGDFVDSFDAIQKLVFERRGCTANACHGAAQVGGLDLRASAAWPNLVGVSASGSKFARVNPGDPAQSYLYLKLQAATDPGKVQVAGSPMPVGTAPLSSKELHAIALWIEKGAPRTGIVVNDDTRIRRTRTSTLGSCSTRRTLLRGRSSSAPLTTTE